MKHPLIILVPTRDDHDALGLFVTALRAALARAALHAHLLVIDDGSRSPVTASALDSPAPGQLSVSVLRLRRNLGHQRAIAVGLAYVHQHLPATRLVIMDGDGEDRVEDVPRLLEELDRSRSPCVVFAERTRRSESVLFQAAYQAFRLLHRFLTGIPVKFGNFSAVPAELISTLVVGSELWNHYAAAVLKLGLPYRSIPTVRGQRLAGESRMNPVGFVVHGLSAISVFGEVVGVRLFMFGATLSGVLVAILAVLAAAGVLTDDRLSQWVVALIGISLVLLMQLGIAVFGFVFAVLTGRTSTNVIPLRDYRWFVDDTSPAAQGAAGGPR